MPLCITLHGQLWTLFAMKKAVIRSESVLITMNKEHLLPSVSLLFLGTSLGCLCKHVDFRVLCLAVSWGFVGIKALYSASQG